MPNPSQTPEPRTLFSARFRDRNAYDIRTEPNSAELTSRHEHSASWQFIRNHPDVNSILYPSCRCPARGVNGFTRDIATLDQNPKALVPFLLIFRPPAQACYIVSAHQDPRWPSLGHHTDVRRLPTQADRHLECPDRRRRGQRYTRILRRHAKY